MGPEWYKFIACAEAREPVSAGGGVQILTSAGLNRLRDAGTIVIPGWRTDGRPPSRKLRSAIVAAHARGARLVTICSGVFLLAACGLLDGRRVTTHWRHFSRLKELHPELQIEADVLYVDEGNVMTSAGSAAGVDLLLHIVRKDFGADAANTVARRLVMPPHREGGQTQYIPKPVPPRPEGLLLPLLDRVRSRPSDVWTIAKMAKMAKMSERTFIRRFQEATGQSPGDWLLAVRTGVARDLLERTAAGLDEVAATAGFGSAATLRHHFKRRLGTSPRAYRLQFALT